MAEKESESGLKKLKQGYAVLKEKYNLPSFSEINELFEIEELCECETEFLIKRIRRVMSERVAGHLRFVDTLINPSNAPMSFFKMLKNLNSLDKEALNKISFELGKFEVEIVKLDLEHNEDKEAEFIKKIFSRFAEIKKEILSIVGKMSDGKESTEENHKSYFG